MSPDRPRRSGGGGRPPRRSGSRRQPAGLDRAARTPGGPPRPGARRADPPRPSFPDDLEADLPRGVMRELRRQIDDPDLAKDVARALTAAAQHLDEEDGPAALRYLEWARHAAPRSGAVREAVGVAQYLTGDYAAALTELQAYARMTGRADQNHVIADCHRALGRGRERVPGLVEAMVGEAPADRVTEGVIVWASMLADEGDVGAGRAVLRRRLAEVEGELAEEHHLRLWYVAADLADRDGDRDAAVDHLRRITAQARGFFDAEQRLAELEG